MKTLGILIYLAFMSFGLIHSTDENVEFKNLVWNGKITPDGEIYTLEGPLHKIHEEILSINPNYYSEDFGIGETHYNSHKELKKRDHIICDLAGDKATLRDIRTVIKRLKGNKGQCTAAAGPGVCTRLECAFGSYVTFCNDNNTPLTRNCAEFGDMAQTIVDSCTPRNSAVLIGQYFNDGFKFNALLKGGGPC